MPYAGTEFDTYGVLATKNKWGAYVIWGGFSNSLKTDQLYFAT